MKDIKLCIGAFFLLHLLLTPQLKASHVMGTNIRWECMAADSFMIVVTSFRDCNGIPLSGGGIAVIDQCNKTTISAGGKISGAKDVTPVCKTACTRCSNPSCSDTRYGIQQSEITAYIKLDRTKCCEWKITWQQCCRNGALTTLDPDNLFIESSMNICSGPCNNSPYLPRLRL